MTRQKKFNPLQYIGLVLGVLGIAFIAFPNTIGTLSIKMITFLFLMMAFIGLTISITFKSLPSIILSTSVLLMSFYTFVNPDYLLFIIGIGFILNGVNGMSLFLRKNKRVNENTILTSLLFILLGVFALINAQAALTTVVMIFGILMTVFGAVLFVSGKAFKTFATFETTGFSTAQTSKSNSGKRIVIDIESDDIDEVDFKEEK